MHVHALFPELRSSGGLQKYGRTLLASLEAVLEPRGGTLEALSLNDSRANDNFLAFGGDECAFITEVLKAIRDREPNVVFIALTNLAPVLLLYRAFCPRARVYVIAHGKEVESPRDLIVRFALRRSHRVLCVSEATRRSVVERQRIPHEKTDLLYYGHQSDAGYVSCARASMGNPTLLSVSRLESADVYKGVDVTIEALGRVLERLPQAHLVVVGDGNDVPRLRSLAQALGIDDHVTFAGSVSDQELDSWYRACDIFVLPSTREGLGIVYLEAMERGKPVIAARAGGAPDVVVHEANGLLVDRSTPELVAAAIERLGLDCVLRRRLGEWGRQNTLPRFSAQRMCEALERILYDVPLART